MMMMNAVDDSVDDYFSSFVTAYLIWSDVLEFLLCVLGRNTHVFLG